MVLELSAEVTAVVPNQAPFLSKKSNESEGGTYPILLARLWKVVNIVQIKGIEEGWGHFQIFLTTGMTSN